MVIMEIVGAIASMGQCICGLCCSNECISEQRSYLKRPQTVVKALEERVCYLTAKEVDVRTQLRIENMMRGWSPTREVTVWLENVREIKATLDGLKVEIEEKRGLLCGCFPNYYYRLKLGNKVSEMIYEVDTLRKQLLPFFPGALVNRHPEMGKILPTSMLVGETARSIVQKTLGYLADPNMGIIGIYGMGGLGKTTIAKEINNMHVKEKIRFDDVFWVTASKDSNLQKLQQDIAKAIGLCFDDNDDDELKRASALLLGLLQRGRVLLIIDDLWEAFSLKNIGIPTPINLSGCKLLITTRSLDVCHGMETTVEIQVPVLSEEDAWDLFKQKAGELVLSSPTIQELAKKVANECGGIPLALITIGRALRKEKNTTQWEAALCQLGTCNRCIRWLDEVFARLRFSYERLENDTTRSCFLYCALYPEDHHIKTEELIKYWLWEGLLGTTGNQIGKMQRGKMILNELKNACMLESICEDGQTDEYVKMHDLIRDMAIEITREKPRFMVESGRGLRVLPFGNEWHPELERVSLMRNDLNILELTPPCPNLRTLLLQFNSFDKGIKDTFFNHMQNLKILDLSYTGIEDLPLSIFNLENLHVLRLCSCWNLRNVPAVSKMKELRALDVSYTSIAEVPEGMDMLLNLQHLNLSHTSIADALVDLLPTYKLLEDLSLVGSWECTPRDIFMNALLRCTHLVVLEISFSSMDDFTRYIRSGLWTSLHNFKFFIGYPQSSAHIGKNSIGLFGVDINETSGPVWFPDNTLELEIYECHGITHLPLFAAAGASRLQRCKIRYCHLMDCIFVGEWSTFATLEWLEIVGLSVLRGICKGIVPEGTFASLKVLHVSGCNNLTSLLPPELAKNLINLVEINIENCKKIAEVIHGVEGDEVTQVKFPDMVLPMLQKMKLSDLPQLEHLYNGLMICDGLSSVEVYGCPELKTLPFLVVMREQMLCSLKQIKGSESWWRALRRNHGNAINILNPIFKQVDEHPSVSGPSSIQEDSDGGS